jgi:predicted amidohydrolase
VKAGPGEFVLAAVQHAPVYWDSGATTELACRLISEAGESGANVVAFGEGWLPGYPFFAHSLPSKRAEEAALRYIENAIRIPGPETEALALAAKEAGVDVVIGAGEVDPVTDGSVYCSLVFISAEGELLGRHRKLKATYRERLVWADGGADGLRVYERKYARLSGLNCWEHQMLLPAYALIAQGTQVHVATWPGWDPEGQAEPAGVDDSMLPRMRLLSRAFASQAAAYVISTGGLWRPEDVPSRFRSLIKRPRTGDSTIISPSGAVLAGPLHDAAGILTAVGSKRAIVKAKQQCDIGGHYARPDVFDFRVRPAGTPLLLDRERDA